eukprot:gene10738-17813_t
MEVVAQLGASGGAVAVDSGIRGGARSNTSPATAERNPKDRCLLEYGSPVVGTGAPANHNIATLRHCVQPRPPLSPCSPIVP